MYVCVWACVRMGNAVCVSKACAPPYVVGGELRRREDCEVNLGQMPPSRCPQSYNLRGSRLWTEITPKGGVQENKMRMSMDRTIKYKKYCLYGRAWVSGGKSTVRRREGLEPKTSIWTRMGQTVLPNGADSSILFQ